MKVPIKKFLTFSLPFILFILWSLTRSLLFPAIKPSEFVGGIFWIWLILIGVFIFLLKLSSEFCLYNALFLTAVGSVITMFSEGQVNDLGEAILRLALLFWVAGVVQSWIEIKKNQK